MYSYVLSNLIVGEDRSLIEQIKKNPNVFRIRTIGIHYVLIFITRRHKVAKPPAR